MTADIIRDKPCFLEQSFRLGSFMGAVYLEVEELNWDSFKN